MPATAPRAALAATETITPLPPREYWLHIDYPADSTNYLWRLQESTNLLDWVDIAPRLPGSTNLLWFSGNVSTNWADVVPPASGSKFWRMRGVRKTN